MNRTTISLSEITVLDRQRQDLGDIDSLAESISLHGLIQPIVVNQDHRLIAGGRRYAAHVALGLKSIDVVYKETLSETQLRMLELEENTKRKDFNWQEKCLALAEWHKCMTREKALASESWGQRETGAMLNVDVCSLNYAIQIATFLRDKDSVDEKRKKRSLLFWQCDSLSEAHRLKLRLAEEILVAKIAELERQNVNSQKQEETAQILIQEVEKATASPDLLATERDRYNSNPNNVVSFEVYWKEKTELANAAKNTIYISNRFICGDSIAYMLEAENAGRFDHIITDIPYGIDMEMLNQQNPYGGMQNLDTVIDEHDVSENLDLIEAFFPAAFACTKDSAFVITWADVMNWQLMYDLAIKAGFAVQRWPITWKKTHACMNQCAQFNTTKDTEIAIVCRKPKSTLVLNPQTSLISASNVEMRKATGHPFAKPFECWEFLVKMVSTEGQTILEPFAGRGSGTLSMLRMKRNVISVEKKVEHFNSLIENCKTQYYLKQNPNYVFK